MNLEFPEQWDSISATMSDEIWLAIAKCWHQNYRRAIVGVATLACIYGSQSLACIYYILENDNIIAQPREHFIQVVSV